MNASDTAVSLYLMDWHGHLLSHDPMRDIFSVAPFSPGKLPDLTIRAPKDFSLPTEIHFAKHISMPKLFPTCIMNDAGEGYVSLFFPHTQRYLTSLPAPEQQEQAPIRAMAVHGWEKFIPFTPTALRGLSLLMLPELCSITSEDGNIVSALTINNRSNIGFIDNKNIKISENIHVFEKIGILKTGESKKISFKNLNEELKMDFFITIK
nr:hypothetical protein [uncultured Neokomagataea sp.]